MIPMLCSLATEDHTLGRHVILDPYEQLINIGEVPVPILNPSILSSFS